MACKDHPLDCLVHQRAAAGTQIKGNDCHFLLGSSGDGLVWPDIIAGSCPEVVDVEGEIDIYTAPRLRELLIDLADKNTCQLIVNLEKVGFPGSTGLGCWPTA